MVHWRIVIGEDQRIGAYEVSEPRPTQHGHRGLPVNQPRTDCHLVERVVGAE